MEVGEYVGTGNFRNTFPLESTEEVPHCQNAVSVLRSVQEACCARPGKAARVSFSQKIPPRPFGRADPGVRLVETPEQPGLCRGKGRALESRTPVSQVTRVESLCRLAGFCEANSYAKDITLTAKYFRLSGIQRGAPICSFRGLLVAYMAVMILSSGTEVDFASGCPVFLRVRTHIGWDRQGPMIDSHDVCPFLHRAKKAGDHIPGQQGPQPDSSSKPRDRETIQST
jgi:hypothetical protein